MPEELWVSKWFMTIFTLAFDFDMLLRIWDYFIIRGITGLYEICLAVIYLLEDALLSLDICELSDTFRDLRTHITNPELLINTARKYNVTETQIKKY